MLNLTTTIDSLAFNHDGQMLVMASRMKRDALRCALYPFLLVWPLAAFFHFWWQQGWLLVLVLVRCNAAGV